MRRWPELLGHVAGHHLDRALHRAVGDAAGIDDAGQARGDVHDPAAVRDQRQQRLGEEERALDVDAIGGVEILLGHVGEGAAMRGAGHVDEEVETLGVPSAQHAANLVGKSGEGAGVARIELKRDRTGAGLLDTAATTSSAASRLVL